MPLGSMPPWEKYGKWGDQWYDLGKSADGFSQRQQEVMMMIGRGLTAAIVVLAGIRLLLAPPVPDANPQLTKPAVSWCPPGDLLEHINPHMAKVLKQYHSTVTGWRKNASGHFLPVILAHNDTLIQITGRDVGPNGTYEQSVPPDIKPDLTCIYNDSYTSREPNQPIGNDTSIDAAEHSPICPTGQPQITVQIDRNPILHTGNAFLADCS